METTEEIWLIGISRISGKNIMFYKNPYIIYTRENVKNHAKNVTKIKIKICANFSVIFCDFIRIYRWVLLFLFPLLPLPECLYHKVHIYHCRPICRELHNCPFRLSPYIYRPDRLRCTLLCDALTVLVYSAYYIPLDVHESALPDFIMRFRLRLPVPWLLYAPICQRRTGNLPGAL